MSSEIKYRCNFCQNSINGRTATKMGDESYCTFGTSASWTCKLELNVSGPHICHNCVVKLVAFARIGQEE